jgi:hypothetical protein
METRISRWRWGVPAGALLAIVAAAVLSARAPASDYEARRTAAVKACEAIDPSKYQTGLAFNPEGFRSFYLRSQCFQDAAVLYRDETLCEPVKQRRALFSSSWGYSPAHCRDLVRAGTESDRRELEAVRRAYLAAPLRLDGFAIEPNGNGRDVDIVPAFSGGYAHGYRLTFEVLEGGRPPAIIHAGGYYVDPHARLRIYVRQTEIRDRVPGLVPGQVYPVRGTLTLEVGTGGPAGLWSEAFVERVFPMRERSQAVIERVRF